GRRLTLVEALIPQTLVEMDFVEEDVEARQILRISRRLGAADRHQIYSRPQGCGKALAQRPGDGSHRLACVCQRHWVYLSTQVMPARQSPRMVGRRRLSTGLRGARRFRQSRALHYDFDAADLESVGFAFGHPSRLWRLAFRL